MVENRPGHWICVFKMNTHTIHMLHTYCMLFLQQLYNHFPFPLRPFLYIKQGANNVKCTLAAIIQKNKKQNCETNKQPHTLYITKCLPPDPLRSSKNMFSKRKLVTAITIASISIAAAMFAICVAHTAGARCRSVSTHCPIRICIKQSTSTAIFAG